jgi:serine phosphatase RsbU (regulator of sigma subunit)
MNRLQRVYRKLINSLFGDVEVFFGLPKKWKIRGALAVGFLYLAVMVLLFMILYPVQTPRPGALWFHSIGYGVFLLGIITILLPIFIPRLQRYPGWLIVFSILFLAISFNILFSQISHSVELPIFIAFYIGLLSIAFGSRLYSIVIREVSSEKARIDTEIRLAQKIQTDLLPVVNIDESRYQAFGRTVNAQEVGGDFFDLIQLDDTRAAFCVGDVSGHNIAAGLIMGIVKSAFRTELRYTRDLESIAASLNKTVIEQASKSMFVSVAAGIIDFQNRKVELINAGHPPILHYRDRRINEIRLEGAALGLAEGLRFISKKRDIAPGDVLFCYTDGVIESRNKSGEELGFRGFVDSIGAVEPELSPQELYKELYGHVENFIGDATRIDDITLLIIKIQ